MEIKECSQEFWGPFVENSPQGTVFNKSSFLKSYGLPVKYLICYKGAEAIAGFGFVCEQSKIRVMPFSASAGIIFKDLNDCTCFRRNETVYLALEAFARYLFENYQEVDFQNHWDVQDMRAFDWFHYHEREKGYFRIIPRYTSLLDIAEPRDTSKYAKGRIWDINKGAQEHRFVTKESTDIALLNRFHEMTFSRQGIQRSAEEVESMSGICKSLLATKEAKLFVTCMDDEPAAASLFMFDRFRAYYLFSGGDDKYREWGVGTKNLSEVFLFLNKELGLKEVDMVGINSPQRGAYKLSYGGRIVPYFRVKKESPSP
jgi:hypothetical protein